MEITTHSFEHFLLSMYVIFVMVDLAVAYRDKVRLKRKSSLVVSYFYLFYREHRWTLLGVVSIYLMRIIYLTFFN